MDPWKLGLTLHGVKYNYKELLEYSTERIVSADTHPWEKEIFRFIIDWLSNNDHIIQFSSGTTGKPKRITLLKRSMFNSALNTCSFLGLQKGDIALLCIASDYIAGKMMIVRSLVSDLDLYITEPKSLPDIFKAPTIDLCAMVPLQVANLLGCQNDLSHIKKLLIGGSEISPELEKMLQPVSTEAFATYGMAETSSHVALRRLNGPASQKYYTAVPGVTLSADDRGCLVIQADFLPRTVITNDLVEFTAKNTFIWIGRYDNLINSGGIKIVPEDIESVIMEKENLECVALGIPDKKSGQKLVIVIEENKSPVSLPLLKSGLENILPKRWKPKEIFLVKSFPRNNSMKIDRNKLLEMILKH